MIPDRAERLSALAELLRPWTCGDASDKVHSHCESLDFVWMLAEAESKLVRPRRRKAKEPTLHELARLKAPFGARIVHYSDIAEEIAVAFNDPLPVVKKERRPPKYAADAAVRSALATYESLMGTEAARHNAQIEFGRTGTATERRGATLAFCRALDAFYGLNLSTDTRIAEGIRDLSRVGLRGLLKRAE